MPPASPAGAYLPRGTRDVARSGTGELGLAGSDTLCQAWLWWACKCLGNAADRAAASAGDVNVQHVQRRVPCQ